MNKNERILFLFRIVNLLIVFILILLPGNSQVYNVIGMAILCLTLLSIYISRPTDLIGGLPYYVALLPMLIGGFLIEEGGFYLFEIDQFTYRNGTFLRSLFFLLIFIEFLLYPVKKSNKPIIGKISILIEVIIVLCISILYLYFIKTGVPVIDGIHRSEYFSSMVPYYINLIKGRLSFFCLILGTYYVISAKKRFVFYFALVILYYLLCSIKGGELIILIYMFTLPSIVSLNEIKNNTNRKIRIIIFALAASLLTLITIHYKYIENYDTQTNQVEKLLQRFTAAGQVWWAINDSKQVESEYRPDDFIYNFEWGDENNYSKGMNQLMNAVVPSKYLAEWRSNEKRGRSLANGFPAIGYYYFEYLGAFFITIIMGFFIYASKKIILNSVENNDVISFLFIGPIIEVLIRVVAQGDIQLFFEKRFYVIFFGYLFYHFVIRRGFRKISIIPDLSAIRPSE